jgi:hypothetical protein
MTTTSPIEPSLGEELLEDQTAGAVPSTAQAESVRAHRLRAHRLPSLEDLAGLARETVEYTNVAKGSVESMIAQHESLTRILNTGNPKETMTTTEIDFSGIENLVDGELPFDSFLMLCVRNETLRQLIVDDIGTLIGIGIVSTDSLIETAKSVRTPRSETFYLFDENAHERPIAMAAKLRDQGVPGLVILTLERTEHDRQDIDGVYLIGQPFSLADIRTALNVIAGLEQRPDEQNLNVDNLTLE